MEVWSTLIQLTNKILECSGLRGSGLQYSYCSALTRDTAEAFPGRAKSHLERAPFCHAAFRTQTLQKVLSVVVSRVSSVLSSGQETSWMASAFPYPSARRTSSMHQLWRRTLMTTAMFVVLVNHLHLSICLGNIKIFKIREAFAV